MDNIKKKNMALVILVLVLTLVIGYLLGICLPDLINPQIEEENALDVTVLEEDIHSIKELVSVEYSYTNMARYENHNEFYGVKIPFTTNKFIVTFDGVIKAGIDLQKAVVKLTEDSIVIYLPKAEILAHTIDFDSLEVSDESYSLFNKLEIRDYSAFTADQQAGIEVKAIEKGILETAESNIKNYLTSYLNMIDGNREIVFKRKIGD